MRIEQFVAQSVGDWTSMRSSHSLAFKQFEQIVSNIKIQSLEVHEQSVSNLIQNYSKKTSEIISPFLVSWNSNSDWSEDSDSQRDSGTCILIPIPKQINRGSMIRSLGYSEPEQTLSNYELLADNTFLLTTIYKNTIAEERIWFLSENVRCRASSIKSASSGGLLQTSYSSEIRII